MRRGGWVALGAFGVALVTFVVIAAGVGIISSGILDTGERPRLSITAVFAVVASLTLLPYLLMARASEGRAPAVAAITTFGWVAALFAIGDYELGCAIVKGPATDGSVLGIAGLAAIGGVLAAAIAAPAFAAGVRSGDVLRVVAPVVWTLGVILVVLSARRVARLSDPDTYGMAFPTQATIDVHQTITLGTQAVRLDDPSIDYGRCFLIDPASPGPRITTDSLPCSQNDLLRDDANRLWIVRMHHVVRGGDAALRFGSLEQVTIFPRTIAKSIGPPIGWVLGAAIALLLALVALVAGFVMRSRDRARAAGVHLGALAITGLGCATLVACMMHGLIF